MKKRARGFTLIELLVVIAIIGLLASVVLTSLNVARTKSQYVQEETVMHGYNTSLQEYYLDNGYYPDPGDSQLHCIGTGYTDDTCSVYTAATTVNSAIQKYYPNLPSLPNFPAVDDTAISGPLYQCVGGYGTGQCNHAYLEWFEWKQNQGDDSCNAGGSYVGLVICDDTGCLIDCAIGEN